MRKFLPYSLFLIPYSLAFADPVMSEISIDLKLDHIGFVVGERVRGIVDVVNTSPDVIRVGGKGNDRCLIEVFRANDRGQLESISDRRFVADFVLKSCEGQKLEVFLGDHYGLRNPDHYLARPVLVHNGMRYEGRMRAFDVVPGMRIGGALQIFANRDGMQRAFDLLTWNREEGKPHIFLFAHDMDAAGNKLGGRKWLTTDLGPMMKITKPTISVMPTGEVIVLHRVDPDNFIRSEFWSVPDDIVFNRRELIQDPETAGTARVREMYKESGGIAPKENPWWKFW